MANYFYLSPSTDGYCNLGTDEWFLDHIGDDDFILYFYINRCAVIIGRNQNPWCECDLNAMERDGVQLVRRISGGGAVFHDEGNLNFSFIAGKNRYDLEKQTNLILHAVQSLGIACGRSGRNDLTADGRKFSGNAFCARNDKQQHHGTLLVCSDLARLASYLQVDPEKLQSKGVASVRSRVCNLSELCPGLQVNDVQRALLQAYSELYGPYQVFSPTEAQRMEMRQYETRHASWDWRFGKTPRFDIRFNRRFAWGGCELMIAAEHSRITSVTLCTDANDAELPARINALLCGMPFDRLQISQALLASPSQEMRDIGQFLSEQAF